MNEESNPDQPPLLPRSAWSSQVSYLRIVFKVKKALDKIEQEFNSQRGPASDGENS